VSSSCWKEGITSTYPSVAGDCVSVFCPRVVQPLKLINKAAKQTYIEFILFVKVHESCVKYHPVSVISNNENNKVYCSIVPSVIQIENMRLHNTYKNSLLAIALVLFGGIAMAQGDLAISLTQSSTSPAQYTFYSVELTVQNEGSVSVADIIVDVPMPAGVVYEGGNEFSSTGAAATFTAYGSNQGLLTVAELLPGESSVVTINYFLRVPSAPAQYAQVLTASEPDVDSTPGNGTPPTVNEDDEASTEINGGFVPDLTLTNLSLVQNTVDSGEQVDFTFDINNIGTGSIAQNFLVQAYISVDDQLSPDDLQNGTVPTGNFAAGQTVSGVVGASLPTGLAPGNYFLILEADANGQVLESNETNNTIFVPLTIEASTPTACEVAIANSTLHLL